MNALNWNKILCRCMTQFVSFNCLQALLTVLSPWVFPGWVKAPQPLHQTVYCPVQWLSYRKLTRRFQYVHHSPKCVSNKQWILHQVLTFENRKSADLNFFFHNNIIKQERKRNQAAYNTITWPADTDESGWRLLTLQVWHCRVWSKIEIQSYSF